MYDALIPIGPIMVCSGFRHTCAVSFFVPALIPISVSLDGCKSTMAGVHRGCGLPVERHCWERG